MSQARYTSLFERLVANSEKPVEQNENGCWLWTGNTDSKGYARLTLRLPGRRNPTGMRASRLMEGIFRADDDELVAVFDPDLETIEHLCAKTGCINPDHWVLIPRGDNTAAMRERNKAAET